MKKILIFGCLLLCSCQKRHVLMKDFPYDGGSITGTSQNTDVFSGEIQSYIFLTVTEKGKSYEWVLEVPDSVYNKAWHTSYEQYITIPKTITEEEIRK